MTKIKRRLVEDEEDDSELVLEEIPIRVGSQKKYSGTPTTSTGVNGLKGLMPSRGNHSSDEQHEVMMVDRGEMAGSSAQTRIMESSHNTLISSTITSSEIRTIHVNDEMRNDFCGNSIKTTKYEFWNFIPKNLFEQFHRFANCYFMAMALLQTIPGLSPTGRWTSFVPLSVVLLCTMIKDAYEDINRRISDRETNNRVAHVLRNGVFVDIPWKQVKTGDIIKVNNLEQFPCDILIYSIQPMEKKSGENLCYVETSQLDGETNLKIRIANVETSSFTSPRDFENKRMKIECELPNNRLYKFEGTLTMDNGKKIALSPDNICLRGSSLKNTQSILGVAVYTGNDTKFMKNTKKTPHKMSNIERLTNRLVLLVLGVQLFLVTCCDIGLMVWTSEQQPKAWYIFPKARDHDIGFVLFNGFKGFFTILILLTNLIPVSLYVSIEATKLIQGSMISKDLEMYHEETDTRANVRSCALNEDLGQINYIFSDKTGTLTENKMNLLKISINGKIYDITDPQLTNGNWRQSEDSNEILQFLLLLSLCHTVIPERLTETKDNQDNTIYHSSSPDEVALVKAAKFLGVEFLDKTTNQANVQVLEEFTLKYHLLDCIEFSSERKRQSVIVRNERGEIILYTKGADSVMFPLLSSESNHLPSTLQHIDRFGSTGLRTLVCAMRVLDETEYQTWHEEYERAKTSLDNRKEKIETVATKIEKDLLLCGATGIEDKLQEGVADTIYNLRLAGINIWVLTGDKMETAINIGFSCELLGSSMKLLKVEGETYDSMERYLTDCLTKLENNSPSKLDNSDVISSEFALVIDGEKLELVFSHQHLIDLFLHVSIKCKSVICCRVSPKQKADIVLLIKKNVESVTLAIGDGANDCNMIQSAHVGIGISGLEGLAAVNVSDYSIAQFRFLKKLLLVHGRWSYRRVSKLVLYCFYKNSVLFLTQVWFIFFNGFSGTSIHDKWNITMYNLLFSGVPIVVFAVLDRDVSSTSASMFPELYFQGRKNRFFNWKVFISWIVNSIFHSLVCFFIPYLTFAESKFPDGQDIDAQTIGIVMYTCAVLVITMKLAIETSTWTWINFFTYGLSLALWPIYLFLYGSTFQLFRKRAPFVNESYDISQRYRIIFTAQFWLVIMLVVVTCCIRDVFWKWWIRYFQTKKLYYLVQSLQHESITRDHIAHHMPSIDQEEMKPPTVYLKSKILPTSLSNLKEKIISCFGSRRKYAEF